MAMDDEICILIEELDRANGVRSDEYFDGLVFPNFVRADDGFECHFTEISIRCLNNISHLLHSNLDGSAPRIQIPELSKLVRVAVANLYAEGELRSVDNGFVRKSKRLLTARVLKMLEESAGSFTHFFPVWVGGIEQKGALNFGSVSLVCISEWINSVNFDPRLVGEKVDPRWKDVVIGKADLDSIDAKSVPLVGGIVRAMSYCNAVISVPVVYFEFEYSRKLGRIVGKTLLDTISLLYEDAEIFQMQVISDERLAPLDVAYLSSRDGHLGVSGGRWKFRHPFGSRRNHDVHMRVFELREAVAKVLEGLLSEKSAKHPRLAARWATALNWFAEGCRESEDAIAIAKIGTCLDVLSCGGRSDGITEMVCNLTGRSRDSIATTGSNPRTLKVLVGRIYEYGRSQVLHGNHVDRLKSFANDRYVAGQLAGHVLREALARLGSYNGSDEDDAFRCMRQS